jgi:hypothetical protein
MTQKELLIYLLVFVFLSTVFGHFTWSGFVSSAPWTLFGMVGGITLQRLTKS